MTRKSVCTLSLILSVTVSYSQTDSVKYTRDFVLKEGIYVTIADFKKNAPPLTPENFKKYNPDIDYIGGKSDIFYTTKKNLFFPDSLENIREILIDSLFGYSTKKHLHIFQRNPNLIFKRFDEFRIIHLGQIGFGVQVETINTPGVTYQGLSVPATSILNSQQYLFDYKNEKLYDATLKNFEKLLSETDKELYEEFSKLSNSKKKDRMVSYILRVNKRHPIYFKN